MSITWYTTNQERNIGGTNYQFKVIINGNNGTAEQIYEFVQRQLRKNVDIDAGAGVKIGVTTLSLLKFVGDTLYTIYYPDDPQGGVFIDNFQNSDINRLVFTDNTKTERTFPYTAVLRLNFGDYLKNDPNAKYWVFFANNYNSNDALLVNTTHKRQTATRARSNNVATITFSEPHGLSVGDGITITNMGGTGYNGQWVVLEVVNPTTIKFINPGSNESTTTDTNGIVYRNMSGKVNNQSYVTLTFDYDYNDQGGRTPGTDAEVVAVAIGLNTAQYVSATGTIQRSTANVISLIAALERNYANP